MKLLIEFQLIYQSDSKMIKSFSIRVKNACFHGKKRRFFVKIIDSIISIIVVENNLQSNKFERYSFFETVFNWTTFNKRHLYPFVTLSKEGRFNAKKGQENQLYYF